ncbi:MAG: TolC family protein [Bacteroidales bacterium]|nr:TolC family protein [Bacteroidales bacterium]
MKKHIILLLACLTLTGCGIYHKYEQTTPTPSDVFGTDESLKAASGETTIAQMSWREFFTDPQLQQLIEQVLENNTDLNSARIAVEKSQAALKAARWAYLPALGFAPQGALSSFDGSAASYTYNLPLQMSLDIDAFGSITNKKRAANAVLMQAQMQQDAIRSNLVSLTAQHYLMLQVLDSQLDILIQTDSLWNKSLETEQALWENGKAYSTAVNQMEASCLNVKTQIADTRRNIRSVENALCKLLAVTPQHINRQKLGGAISNTKGSMESNIFNANFLQVGIPAQMLENRPDIRMANYAMEEAFYNTQVARAAFYPNITLSGIVGWTNNAGIAIVNPGKLLLNAVAQLTQPIFARGTLIANKKIAQLTEEDLQKKYVQMVINAGNEVNEAMAGYTTANEKHDYYQRQVQVLREAYKGTHELMDNGKASYIEVLMAQESLLQSQLSAVMNMYDASESVIALYIALGGGTK